MKIPGKWWEKKTRTADEAGASTTLEKDANMDNGTGVEKAGASLKGNASAETGVSVAATFGSNASGNKAVGHANPGNAAPATTGRPPGFSPSTDGPGVPVNPSADSMNPPSSGLNGLGLALGGSETPVVSGAMGSAATAGASTSSSSAGIVTSAVVSTIVPATAEKTSVAVASADKPQGSSLTHDKRRALGRGLESLLPGPRVIAGAVGTGAAAGSSPAPGTVPLDGSAPLSGVVPELHAQAAVRKTADGHAVIDIPVDRVEANPHQTRRFPPADMPELEELATSIRVHGVVQPITVRPGKDGHYILISGERRLRASKLAEKTAVPAIVRVVSEQQAAEITVVENLQREDLNCMDQARAFIMLSQNFGLTQEQIGQRVGASRESISNYMRLAKLPPLVQDYLQTGQLDFSHARILLNLKDPDVIARVAHRAAHESMSVEKLEHFVLFDPSMTGATREAPKRGARWVDPNVRAAQRDLERILGVKVRIRDRKGKGKITLEYSTLEDFDRVIGMLKGKK